jgi:hypothetical protein
MSDIVEQINILIEVQDVEMEILQANRKMDALTSEATSLDKSLAERKREMADGKEALDELNKSYRLFELELKEITEQITKSNEKLRVVKTNKEYQSILKEIEETRKRKSQIEDRMLEIMEQLETEENSVKEKENELSVFVESCREKKEALSAKGTDQKKVITELVDKKKQIENRADPKHIALLEDVRKKVRGDAVVSVQGAICTGCHMNIPAQLYNELQRCDELRFCPHCHRIIYWKQNA